MEYHSNMEWSATPAADYSWYEPVTTSYDSGLGHHDHQPLYNYDQYYTTTTTPSYYPAQECPNWQNTLSYDNQTFGELVNVQEQPQQSVDFLDIDDIISSVELDSNDLHEVLSTAGLSDLLYETSSLYNASYADSAFSTPKRKYSTDSLSSSSFDTASSSSPSSSSGVSSPASSDDGLLAKPKRLRRAKHTKEERVVRKKDQNKKAASKYRHKKKEEKSGCEQTLEQLETIQQQYKAQIEKLQTEFNVIIPLAKAAFTFDVERGEQLALLLQRLSNNSLL